MAAWQSTETSPLLASTSGSSVFYVEEPAGINSSIEPAPVSHPIVEDCDTDAEPAVDFHTIDAAWESLDYDVCENEEYRRQQESLNKRQMVWREMVRWIAYLMIGFITGLIAFGLNIGIEFLAGLKFDVLNRTLTTCVNDEGYNGLGTMDQSSLQFCPTVAVSLLIWIAISVACVTVAALLTAFVQPAAGGSGIPQLKAYLNGVRIRAFLDLDALLVKIIGTGLSVASGLAVGQEGPMVHCGAIVAAGMADGRIKLSNDQCCGDGKYSATSGRRGGRKGCGCCRGYKLPTFSLWSYFRNDHDKRDFVSAGSAAGLAAAFGTPLTGVIFSLEEGASFWNQALTLRMLLATMMSCFTIFIMTTIRQHDTNILNAGIFSFGNFQNVSFNIVEIPLIFMVGIVGGLSGAAFNALNTLIAKFRFHYLHHKLNLILEPILVSATIAAVAFTFCIYMPACVPVPLDTADQHLADSGSLVRNDSTSDLNMCEGSDFIKAKFSCPEGYYSISSLLFLQIPERAARALFMCSDPEKFDWGSLLVFFILFFLMTSWCCGLAIPSGIFVPNFVVGAAWGRLLGLMFYWMFRNQPGYENLINPGKYAVFGAAAQMAGVARMTITITCMVAEGTGNVAFGLPVMIVCVIAKTIGDLITEGIYEVYLHLLAIPFLQFDPPHGLLGVNIGSIASKPVSTLRVVETVSRILDVLKSTRHGGFPIVEDAAGPGYSGGLAGLCLRQQLYEILFSRQFMSHDSVGPSSQAMIRPRLSELYLLPQELSQPVDLRPFMNPAPYAMLETASLPKVFRLFRGLGLRHLVVVNRRNEVVGIITRKDLAVFHDVSPLHHENRRSSADPPSKPRVLAPSEGFVYE